MNVNASQIFIMGLTVRKKHFMVNDVKNKVRQNYAFMMEIVLILINLDAIAQMDMEVNNAKFLTLGLVEL